MIARVDSRRAGVVDSGRRGVLAAVAVAPLVAGLGACALGRAPTLEYHPLRDASETGGRPSAAPATPAVDKVLLLASGGVPTLYDTDRMVFSRDGSSLSYFQYGRWTQAPAKSLLALTEQRLSASGLYRNVALSTSGVRGNRLLTLSLQALYLDEFVNPAEARLSFDVELLDWQQRSLIARQRFSRKQPVTASTASGLAQAAALATGTLLDELVAWLAA
ncbi:MAG: ABC-type transport auxiliary lipoprotein family protein, partial [Rubrivivax sp.]